jgi:hypothetical protein
LGRARRVTRASEHHRFEGRSDGVHASPRRHLARADTEAQKPEPATPTYRPDEAAELLDVMRGPISPPRSRTHYSTGSIEADTYARDNEDLRGVMDAGHRRDSAVIRTVGEDHEPRQFSAWAPVTLAEILKPLGTGLMLAGKRAAQRPRLHRRRGLDVQNSVV